MQQAFIMKCPEGMAPLALWLKQKAGSQYTGAIANEFGHDCLIRWVFPARVSCIEGLMEKAVR